MRKLILIAIIIFGIVTSAYALVVKHVDPIGGNILLESGSKILMETGDKLRLES